MTRRALLRDDTGAAMLTVLLLLTALTAVGASIAVVSTNNLASASRDRQAAGALATADAGVAQAMEYMRQNSVGAITCLEANLGTTNTSDPCRANPPGWTSPTSPRVVQVDGAATCATNDTCFSVYITAIQPFNPPFRRSGLYRIHSKGVAGIDPGARQIAVDVEVTPMTFPIGVFGKELDGNGGTRIFNEMLFTTDCVSPRNDSPTGTGNGTRFNVGGLDAYWGEPASANSTSVISTSTNCGSAGNIHRTVPCPGNIALNFDRDSQGGPISSTSGCASYTGADGLTKTRTTTKFGLDDLRSYGYRPGGLSDLQYDDLRRRANALGLLNRPVTQLHTLLANAVASGVNNPVVYYDNLTATQNLALSRTDIPTAFARVPGSLPCSNRSIVLVVRNGGLTYQGGTSEWRSMVLLVPEGPFRGNGGYNVLGTLFANKIELGGNENFELDDCFVDNLPGPVIDLDVVNFQEEDRTDIN